MRLPLVGEAPTGGTSGYYTSSLLLLLLLADVMGNELL